ncbi:Imm21 family immunity protein [Aquisphaera insulae]|uniref:Imm21 family immunity protein n=1 Tax=Aquisphaera insulae TaxID=2712864 RepID=UPI0013EAD133|nr:Imm21 family immunity protein [Aquisphaera insulae]
MNDRLSWVGAKGGPLVVIPAEIAPRWRGGVDGTQSLEDLDRWWQSLDPWHGDCGRAWSIKGPVGTLAVGTGRALVLRRASRPTTFVPHVEGGILVRGIYAEDEATLRRALLTMPASSWKPTPHRLTVSDGGLVVFDSALPGDGVPASIGEQATIPCLRLDIPPGIYQVDMADHSPIKTNRLGLYRLRRSPRLPLAS